MVRSCVSCQAMVDFAFHAGGGGSMIIDRKSAGDPKGNLAVWRKPDGTLWYRVLRKGEEPRPGEKRGLPHWATCTRPEAHRKRR